MKKIIALLLVLLLLPAAAIAAQGTDADQWNWEDVSDEVKAQGDYIDLPDFGFRIWVPGWTAKDVEFAMYGEHCNMVTDENGLNGFMVESSSSKLFTRENAAEALKKYADKMFKNYESITINGIPGIFVPQSGSDPFQYIRFITDAGMIVIYMDQPSPKLERIAPNFFKTMISSIQLIEK